MAKYVDVEKVFCADCEDRDRCGSPDVFCDVHSMPAADVAPVVRCKDCKKRNKKKCPLVMVRFDMKTNGTIKEILEQNYVDEDFWCKDGERKGGGNG